MHHVVSPCMQRGRRRSSSSAAAAWLAPTSCCTPHRTRRPPTSSLSCVRPRRPPQGRLPDNPGPSPAGDEGLQTSRWSSHGMRVMGRGGVPTLASRVEYDVWFWHIDLTSWHSAGLWSPVLLCSATCLVGYVKMEGRFALQVVVDCSIVMSPILSLCWPVGKECKSVPSQQGPRGHSENTFTEYHA